MSRRACVLRSGTTLPRGRGAAAATTTSGSGLCGLPPEQRLFASKPAPERPSAYARGAVGFFHAIGAKINIGSPCCMTGDIMRRLHEHTARTASRIYYLTEIDTIYGGGSCRPSARKSGENSLI